MSQSIEIISSVHSDNTHTPMLTENKRLETDNILPLPEVSNTTAALIEPWMFEAIHIPKRFRYTTLADADNVTPLEIRDPRVLEKLVLWHYGFRMDPDLLYGRKFKVDGVNGDAISLDGLVNLMTSFGSGKWHVGIRLHPGENNPQQNYYPMMYYENAEELADEHLVYDESCVVVGWKDLRSNIVVPQPGDTVYVFPIPAASGITVLEAGENGANVEKNYRLNGGFRLQLNTIYQNESGKPHAKLTFEMAFNGWGPRAIEEQHSTIPTTKIDLDVGVTDDGFILPPIKNLLSRSELESLTSKENAAREICMRFLSANNFPTWNLMKDLCQLLPEERSISLEGMYSCPLRKPEKIQTCVIGYDGPNTREKEVAEAKKHLSAPISQEYDLLTNSTGILPEESKSQHLWKKQLKLMGILPSAESQVLPVFRGHNFLQLRQLSYHLTKDQIDIINHHWSPQHNWTQKLTVYAALGRLLYSLKPTDWEVMYQRLELNNKQRINPLQAINLIDIIGYRLGLWEFTDQRNKFEAARNMRRVLLQASTTDGDHLILNDLGKQAMAEIQTTLSKILYGNFYMIVDAAISATREGD